jgi:ParB-like chromosome segregation protein Spo0J
VTAVEFHPVADIFPMMSELEFAGLVVDIRDRDLQEPVWLHQDGRIIDGRNRYRACLEADREPRFRTYDGPDSELVPFVVSLNVHRRHLNESQRAMVAERIATRTEGRPSETDSIELVSRAEAAQLLNVGRESVARARKVATQGVPELAEKVISGEIAVSTAALIADFDEATQHHLASLEDKRQIRALAREIDVRDVGLTANRLVLSTENEWYTPVRYLDAARAVLGGIDLDPASSPAANEVVRAATFYTSGDDGLALPWKGRVWLNPPYGDLPGKFVGRLLEEWEAGNVSAAVVLVNSHCTDTGWFQPLWQHTLCFTHHRIDFESAGREKTSTSTHGSVFVYVGDERPTFAERFAEFGAVVRRWP